MRQATYTIDFETVSTQDLKEVGIRNYVHHEETKVSLVAWKEKSQTKGWVVAFPWLEAAHNEDKWSYLEGSLIQDLEDRSCEVTIIAHNATFEKEVFKKLGWPEPQSWKDTMVRANMVQAPGGLAAAGKALGCPMKLTEVKPLLRKAMRFKREEPKRKTSTCCKIPFTWEKVDGLWYASGGDFYGLLQKYCLWDVYAAEAVYRETSKALGKECWVEHENGEYFTERINSKGIRIDKGRLGILQKVHDYMVTHARAFAQEELGIESLQQKAKALAYFRGRGLELEGVGQEEVAYAISKQPKHPAIPTLKKYAELNKSSLYKLETLSKLIHKGRLYDTLRYCGAYATGRWSGVGFQVQNLPRPTHSREEVEAFVREAAKRPACVLEEGGPDKLVSALRTLIIPDDGEVLVTIDLSQIELRLSAWQSQSPDHALLCEGKDVYSAFASEVFDTPIKKGMAERNVGKEGVLSLQYGAGAKTFQKRLLGAHGIEKKAGFCKMVVNKFRERNPGLLEEWKKYEKQLEDCYYRGEPLSVTLCTGRKLNYGNIVSKETRSPRGKLVGFDYGYNDGRSIRKLWGGIVYQNKIQAEARDIFLEIASSPALPDPIMLVHDEAVFSVQPHVVEWLIRNWGYKVKEVANKYCPGIVLTSEAETNDRYFK